MLSDRPPICRVKMEFGLGGRRGKKRGGAGAARAGSDRSAGRIVRVEQKEKKRLKGRGFQPKGRSKYPIPN